MAPNRSNVIVWTGLMLNPSETFIREQAAAMQRFSPHFVGVRHIGNKSLISRDDCLLVNGGGMSGNFSEAMFKVVGLPPGLRKRVRHMEPSVMHAHHGVNGALALPLARALGLPLIVTFHGADATVERRPEHFSLAHRAFVRRSRKLKEQASCFIAVSEFIKRKLVERGYPQEKIIVHYIGVDTRKFQSDPAVTREPVVLFVGRLAEKKGCEYLIRAMQRVQLALPHVRLVIAGDGPLRASLEAQATSMLRQCTFLGMQSHDVVHQWMNRASILAVPSVTAASGDSEGLPTVIIEAQAMVLPVVGSEHAGIGEAIKDGETGLLAAERDVEKLSEHIMRLCTDAPLRSRISMDARRQVEVKFDIKKQTAILEGIYDEMIERACGDEETTMLSGVAQ